MDAAIAQWREFYGAVANASAALVGLVFVGLSIRLAQHHLEPTGRALALVSAANLLQPLFVALAMLLPDGVPVAQLACFVVIGAATATDVLTALWLERRTRATIPFGALVYRYALPLAASVLLLASAVGLAVGSPAALYGPLIFVTVMIVVGFHNAWLLLLGSLEEAPMNGRRATARAPRDEGVRPRDEGVRRR